VRVSRLLLLAGVLGAGLGAADAQLVRDQRPPLRSGVDLVMVTVTVIGPSGALVTDLPREAFDVYEDGERQTVSVFTSERVPVGLGMLLDVSDSMFGQRIKDARSAVERFLFTLLDPSDEFFVVAFNHAPKILTPWTHAPDLVREALDTVRPTGGTAIYDAVLSALPLIDRRTRQRAAVVVISDGADTASDASLRDVRSALLRSDAFVYAIAIDSSNRQAINTRVNPAALGEITNQSGGRTEVVTNAAELVAATSKIAEELNSQYVLGYVSAKRADGQYHSIRVRLKEAGYQVRARNGYIAVRRPSPND
jgi:Ca-activated chloride channel family protein